MFELKQSIGHLGILKKSKEDSQTTTEGKKFPAEASLHTPEVRLLYVLLCDTLQGSFRSITAIQCHSGL